jgi:endoglucanase
VLALGGAAAIFMPAIATAAPRQSAVRLKRGMNLWPWFSLTREFPPPSVNYDWPPFQDTRAVPTRGDLADLRQAGIDFVRIPVDPGPLLAFSGNRRDALIANVMNAVETALAEGLTVVLNLHANGATHHFNPHNLVGSATAPLFARYLDLVRLVAERLSRFDQSRVAFEPVNEPPQDCVSGWPSLQSEIARAARAAAPRLTLVLTGACGGMIDGLQELDPSAVGDESVIYTFHFYEPYVFSHQGAPWMTGEPMYRYLNSVPWPASAGTRQATLAATMARLAADSTTPAAAKRDIAATIEKVLREYFDARPDRSFVERYFRQVRQWGDRHGIEPGRILLGEFGALRTDERYVAAKVADRARYVCDVRETAEAFGMPWAFWNFFDGMGFTLDDRSREFDSAIVAALGLKSSDIR